jgi:hypothetical protein
MGLGALAEPDIQIEVEDPEAIEITIGDTVIDLDSEEEEGEFDENLAEILPESVLQSLASDLIADYDSDCNSRRDWLETYTKGLDLLGLKYEERMEPWAGACGVTHPLLMESAVRFQSDTIVETFPASGPVKTVIIGKETPEKKEASIRVADDMNYRLTEECRNTAQNTSACCSR